MPRGDRTGPNGMGPMTGRGAGYCAGYPTAGWQNPAGGIGRGFGRGRGGYGMGFGRGMGFRGRAWGGQRAWADQDYYAAPSPEQELDMLKAESEVVKKELEAIGQRIKELDKTSGSKG